MILFGGSQFWWFTVIAKSITRKPAEQNSVSELRRPEIVYIFPFSLFCMLRYNFTPSSYHTDILSRTNELHSAKLHTIHVLFEAAL